MAAGPTTRNPGGRQSLHLLLRCSRLRRLYRGIFTIFATQSFFEDVTGFGFAVGIAVLEGWDFTCGLGTRRIAKGPGGKAVLSVVASSGLLFLEWAAACL